MFQAAPLPPHQLSSPPIDIMSSVNKSPVKVAEQKPRKLRASCDACSRAKVKCDKVRPTCHRCGNMGICCNYSPSMRLGKPRKNRNPDGSIRRDGSPASPHGMIMQRPDMIPRTTTASTIESSPEPMDPFFFGPSTPEYPYQDAFMAGFDGSQSPYSDAGSSIQGWGPDEMFLQNPTAPLFNNPVPQFPVQFTQDVSRPSTAMTDHTGLMGPMDGMSHSLPVSNGQFFPQEQPAPVYHSPEKMMEATPMIIPAPLPTPTTPPITAIPPQNHDCTEFAFSTLSSLYSPPTYQPSASDFGASGGLPTLDTVLSTNKSAIDKVFVLLGCPCSANPHFSTTIAFTIVKILSWYQAVAGMNQAVPTESPVNTQMEAFTHTPISLGAFKLEGEDEERFRVQLVLGELRKVEKLVDKFSERYCKAADLVTGKSEGAGVYGALESLLRTRVNDTFNVTMRNAPEEVKRQWSHRVQRHRHNTV